MAFLIDRHCRADKLGELVAKHGHVAGAPLVLFFLRRRRRLTKDRQDRCVEGDESGPGMRMRGKSELGTVKQGRDLKRRKQNSQADFGDSRQARTRVPYGEDIDIQQETGEFYQPKWRAAPASRGTVGFALGPCLPYSFPIDGRTTMEQVGGLPLITLNGDARSRGLQHGAALSTKIHRMIEVYRGFFGMSDAEVFEIAAHFKSVIRSYNPDYGVEIEGIAEASDADPLWIYALNARSEFLSFVPATECTVLHFKGTPYLGQNWDWEESLEPLITLVRIERNDGPSILMMTEPGIIGKIGLNEAGLGVCFNFLNIDRPTNGLPTHILLRAILEAGSLDDARETIKRAGPGRSSNMLVADRQGDRFDIEFAATEQFEVPDKSAVMAHTNHYLDRKCSHCPTFWKTPPSVTTGSEPSKRKRSPSTARPWNACSPILPIPAMPSASPTARANRSERWGQSAP